MFAGWKMHLAFAYFLRKKFERRVAYLLTSFAENVYVRVALCVCFVYLCVGWMCCMWV